MARKRFVVLYPDGSKEQIGCTERDSLLLSGQIKKIDELRFSYMGHVRTYHNLSDLADIRERMIQTPGEVRRFLPGNFVIEYPRRLGGKKIRELLQTPEALRLRLPAMVAKLSAERIANNSVMPCA